MNKKADLSLQTIVIAVLVLFVLAVLIFISSNFLGGFAEQGKSCSLAGGSCSSGTSCETGSTKIPAPSGGWAKDGDSACNICCSINPLAS